MQVDWISAIVTTPPDLWPGYESGRLLRLSPYGEVLESRVSPLVVEDPEPSSSRTMVVWTPTPGSLYISGNPVKLLQGHNLFGTLDLLGYYLEAGDWVRCHVGLFPSPQTWQGCEFSLPRYTRVDITRSYRFRSDQEALEYVRHVVGHAKSRHGQATLYDSGTAYFGQHSRRWTMKVYAKRQELEALRRRVRWSLRGRQDPSLSDELMDWASGVVRFELTLRSVELARYPTLDLHDEQTLRKLWQRYFDTIQFNENATMRAPDLIEESLPRHLRCTLFEWRQGVDLRYRLPKPTFYRHRQEILARCGIDIAVPPLRDASVQAPKASLDPAGWDPEPLASRLVEPRAELKEQYGLELPKDRS